MPDGHVQRIDHEQGHVFVIRNGRRFVAPINEVEPAARIPGARVHFDLDRRAGNDGAVQVRLVSGTRTNRRHRRFGDLTGARRPGAKVKSTSSSRLGVDVTTQPIRVIEAWVASMAQAGFDDTTTLYAPNAVLHVPGETRSGRRAIRAALEDFVGPISDVDDVSIEGADQLVLMTPPGEEGDRAWFEVVRGAIVEHWHGTRPAQLDEGIDESPAIAIVRSGDVDASQEQRLRDDLERVAARARGPVEEIRVKIDSPATPAHPYSVSIAVFTDGAHVRSHVTAPTFEEAIDTVCLRLRTQLDRAADRLRRRPAQHRPDESSWRHGDRPPPTSFILEGPIPSAREIVRHKSWGPERSSIDEAVWDMEQADYDFYLFTEEMGGDTALIWRGDEGVEARFARGNHSDSSSQFVQVHREPAPEMTIDVALKLLNETHEPFVFATGADGGAFVLYRRFDGHFGLIEPIEAKGDKPSTHEDEPSKSEQTSTSARH